MFLKYQPEIAILLSSLFFSGAAQALKISELIQAAAADVTVVRANGTCSANPYSNQPPCTPTIAVCPTGKIPIPMKKLSRSCTSAASQPAEFDQFKKITLATATTVGTGYVACNPKSKSYYIASPSYQYFPAKVGYSPLCDPVTKVCKVFNYTVTARCITSPTAGAMGKFGVSNSN